MSEMFADPASAVGINWTDLNGSLLLFTVKSQEHGIETAYGSSDAVRADVTVIDGDLAGTEYGDTLVFPKVLQSQLRPAIGGKVVGRLGQGEAKKGQSAPWKLAAATDDEKKAAQAVLNLAASGVTKGSEVPF